MDSKGPKDICYAVTDLTGCYFSSFTVCHPTKKKAFEEAARLARKENKQFFVLKLIGFVKPLERPIDMKVWEHDLTPEGDDDCFDGSECPPAHVLHPK